MKANFDQIPSRHTVCNYNAIKAPAETHEDHALTITPLQKLFLLI